MSGAPDPRARPLDDCGCCAAVTAETPAPVTNREGLDRIGYRVGDHAQFKASLLAALSSLSDPARAPLRDLTTREDDDVSIALLDAWAVLADVLTFYQERLANESYLRTAVDRGSVLELARLIGYELRPGVAAGVRLKFSLDESPGAPARTTIDRGAQVQSVPGPGETAQTFETIEKLEAHVLWNAMKPGATEPPDLGPGVTHLYLRGTATQLQPGDAILIVGDERDGATAAPDLERWDVRELLSVTADADRNLTRVTWADGLAQPPREPPVRNVRVYAFRQRAALFGHNAPDPRLMQVPEDLLDDSGTDWKDFRLPVGLIDLDASHQKVVAGSWIALKRPPGSEEPQGAVELYQATAVAHPSRSDYGLSGKVTRIHPDTTVHLDDGFFPLRDTLVFAQSEPLEPAAGPLITREPEAPSLPIPLDAGALAPVEGTRVTLDREVPPLPKGRRLIVTGRRIRARVALHAAGLALTSDAGGHETLEPGESLLTLASPAVLPGGQALWRLRRANGFTGTITAGTADLLIAAAGRDDEVVSEEATVASAEGAPTRIALQGAGLLGTYDRATVTVAANVAAATHGESVREIGGSGDAGRTFQAFTLKQAPLTYLASGARAGLESTLEVRVDDLLWREAPSFLDRPPDARIYTARRGDDGRTTILFGDGRNGARLPTGQQNVRFAYRKGSGLEGLVRAGQLSQLLTRPLGVREVVNPLPAEGADEPESLADARSSAPLTVLTLDRVVSLQDYEDCTRAWPGIAKALATWTWDGRAQGVLLTVAAPRGAPVTPGGDLEKSLLEALDAAGGPFVPVRVRSYRPASFRVAATVQVHPDHLAEKVLAAVRDALALRFSFDARDFGRPVALSEVIAVMQAVPGVVSVDVDHLQRTDVPQSVDPAPRLLAELPAGGGAPETVQPAELLTLDPASLQDLEATS